ncbi:hypothetical protein EI94DRAFT_1800879 [Lactarius quietus]|nr:hypothetical protein EI94DRAFT_1800879 [Lactarius quietus]
MSSSGEESVLLPLEVNILKEQLPDVLDYNVHDKNSILIIPVGDPSRLALYRSWEKFLARCPVKFVRKYPMHGSTGEEAAGNVSKASAPLDHRTIGQLDLSQQRHLGTSNHSPCTTHTPVGCWAISVDRYMLENEAKIYDKFPSELQEFTPSSVPIVPKFFGYYEPSCESVDNYKSDDGNEEDAKRVREDVLKLLQITVSPILLIESCGKPIKADMVYRSPVTEAIVGIFNRLHNARFTQGSVYVRNILVQPGPLTSPRLECSFDSPSYRLIDFGRGV